MLSRQDSRVYYATPIARYGTADFIARSLGLREYQARYSLRKLKALGFVKSKSGHGWRATNADFYKYVQKNGLEESWLKESMDQLSQYLNGELNTDEPKQTVWQRIYNKIFK